VHEPPPRRASGQRSIATRRAPLALALAVVLAAPAPALADDLSVDVRVTGAITGAAAATFAALELSGNGLTPSTCRWCEPPGIDRDARLHLRWSDPQQAGELSDVLLVTVPASLLVTDFFLSGCDLGTVGEDVLVVVETMTLTLVATDVLKYSTARRRPDAWASGVRDEHDDDNSFVSGHASTTFAGAAAFGTVAMLRGYRGWPFLYAAALSGAAATSYLRVAADRHWVTDVVAGAGLGAAMGVALPLLLHRREDGTNERSPALMITPMPLGVAGAF
jgi:membrane-associated phospholipid phosphatase